MRKNKGITLIVLVVTVIILLILVGISIASLTGKGLLEKTKLAKEKQKNAQFEEDTILAQYQNSINEYVGNKRETIEIDKEEYNRVKNANVYSTEEIEIGTWIDGKTIYRKVFETTDISRFNAGSKYTIVSNLGLNIDKIINLDAYTTGNSGVNQERAWYSEIRYVSTNDSIVIDAHGSYLNILYIMTVVEYTKK